jgi:DNA helicase HerA-like ATPase
MFGKIKYITEGEAQVEANILEGQAIDVMNMNVIFEAQNQRILGEVEEINQDTVKIRFLGEFVNNHYVSGVIRKPLLSSTIRIINDEELQDIVGKGDASTLYIGKSAIYKDKSVYVKLNDLLANHLGIFGNTGSGKSWGVARLVQNMFSNPNLISYNANIFIFDAYGEYKTAFRELNKINPIYTYKFITTNPVEASDKKLLIPTHLLTLDDYILLLQADSHTQIPIIERSLKLAKIFSVVSDNTTAYKNHLIA